MGKRTHLDNNERAAERERGYRDGNRGRSQDLPSQKSSMSDIWHGNVRGDERRAEYERGYSQGKRDRNSG